MFPRRKLHSRAAHQLDARTWKSGMSMGAWEYELEDGLEDGVSRSVQGSGGLHSGRQS